MINVLSHSKYILPIIRVANVKIQINETTVSGQKTEGKPNALRNPVNEGILWLF